MKTIINNLNNEIIVNKSKFIGYIYQVNNLEEINNYLNNLKEQYNDASHICYAYINNNLIKYNDDKEPIGTAGKPILELLQKNNLNNVLAVVVRYFGGIKLGSSNLIRTYQNTIKELLVNNIKEIIKGYLIEIEFPYNLQNNIDYLLKDEKIISKKYDINIQYQVIIKKEILEKLSNISYKIIQEIDI